MDPLNGFIIIPNWVAFDIWVFPKLGVPQNGWFIMENPIKMDALRVHLFLETPVFDLLYKTKSPGRHLPDLAQGLPPRFRLLRSCCMKLWAKASTFSKADAKADVSWLEFWKSLSKRESATSSEKNDWNMSRTVGHARVLRHDSKVQNPKFNTAM